MTELKPLAGNTVADLVAYLLQLPQNTIVRCLEENCRSYAVSVDTKQIDDDDLYYNDWSVRNGSDEPGFVTIGHQ